MALVAQPPQSLICACPRVLREILCASLRVLCLSLCCRCSVTSATSAALIVRGLELLFRERSQMPDRNRALWNDVRLSRGCAAAQRLVEIHGRSTQHKAGIERQMLFARELPPEAVENPRELVIRAVAQIRPENL